MKLETKRLILRPWESTDEKDLIEGLNNLNVSKWLALVPYPYTEADAKSFINFCIKTETNNENRSSYEFAIVLKSENKVIGGLSISSINYKQGTAGGGIWLNEKYAGKGYGTEAWGERIRFAFEDLGLRRLENGFFDGNLASFKMQQKFGAKLEGTKRKGKLCFADGKIKDEHIMGLLKEEWIKI